MKKSCSNCGRMQTIHDCDQLCFENCEKWIPPQIIGYAKDKRLKKGKTYLFSDHLQSIVDWPDYDKNIDKGHFVYEGEFIRAVKSERPLLFRTRHGENGKFGITEHCFYAREMS